MIRPATPADLEPVLRVQEEASRELFAAVFVGEHPPPTDAVRERWRREFTAKPESFVVAEEGEVVAVAIVAPPWIHALHVLPAWWGKGVASELHRFALHQVAAAGEQEALIRVWAQNARARRFWEKHGWTQLEWTERAQDPPHPEIVLYMKDLGDVPE